MAKKKELVTYIGVGRRKSSIARVFMTNGSGDITVNGKDLKDYLPLDTLIMIVNSPLELLGVNGQFNIKINVGGGGLSGQAGAMRHGISRALLEVSDEYRSTLKAAGFLTRDSRSKERKKYGLKAARRAPQYSKR